MSVTAKQTLRVKAAIDTIPDDAWTPIAYREAVYDETTGRWVSRAKVAEVPFTANASKPKPQQVPGRLVVRRIPELNPNGQDGLFDLWRFHAFFTTCTLNTVTADHTHRGHAIIEQVHADLKHSALAHLPSRPPRGQMYPRFATDEELFDSPAEKERIMEDYGLTEEQARAMRHSGLV